MSWKGPTEQLMRGVSKTQGTAEESPGGSRLERSSIHGLGNIICLRSFLPNEAPPEVKVVSFLTRESP